MGQGLVAIAALEKDPGLFPSTHNIWLTILFPEIRRRMMLVMDYNYAVDIHAYIQISLIKIKIKIKICSLIANF